MDLKVFINLILLTITTASQSDIKNDTVVADNVFNGVYSECFLHLSYSCLQKKTLLYLKELNNLNEVSVIGEYVKFVKINKSDHEDTTNDTKTAETEELAFMIDEAIDHFFDNHVLKFYALGRNISLPRNVDEFVGRKKRKGGGGGDGGHGGGGGHDDGGKKKMMMMAIMCMKMKLMMMVPAMMGMMGMMSFKGMMFSMMSFMLSKMMLLMKILEKKGGAGGLGGGGGADGGWAAGGAGGGAWMPAGGQDYGGGGGGYDANGQWQSRSIVDNLRSYKTIENSDNIRPIDNVSWEDNKNTYDWLKRVKEYKPMMIVTPVNKSEWNKDSNEKSDETIDQPEISFVKRAIRYNNKLDRDEESIESNKHPVLVYKRSNVHFDFNDPENHIEHSYGNQDTAKSESRSKRDVRKVEQKVFRNQNFYEINNDKVIVNKDLNNDNTNPGHKIKSRQKRSIIDILKNSYIYWMNQILGLNNNRRTNPPRYKIVNGIKYVYYPYKMQKPKMPKELPIYANEDIKPLMAIEEFNKGEIVEGIESRMNKKKFNKMKDSVNDTMDDNPWE